MLMNLNATQNQIKILSSKSMSLDNMIFMLETLKTVLEIAEKFRQLIYGNGDNDEE